MKNKKNFDIEKLIKDVKKDLKPSKFDPNGSWTGLTKDNISQKEAAIIAVKEIGLNQISEINRCWFNNPSDWEMFNKRLNILKNIK